MIAETEVELENSEASPQSAYPGWQIALSFGLGWLFVVIGLVGVLYAPILAWQTSQFVAQAVRAQAPVVDFKTYPPSGRESHETYRPIVEVTNSDGKTVRCLVGAAEYPSAYKIGQLVEIIYPPGKPEQSRLNDTEDVWGDSISAAILFPVILILGVGVVFWMRYFVKHPPDHIIWLDRWFAPLKILSRILAG